MTRWSLASALLLVGCTVPAPSGSVAVLPPVKAYSAAFQSELFDQAAAIPPGSALDEFFADSIALRCAVQAARGDAVSSICVADE